MLLSAGDRKIARWSFCLAFLIQIAATFSIVSREGTQYFYFENEQSRIAWSLATGHGFSSPWPNTPLLATAQQAPLYPWLLAAIFRIFGAYSSASVWATAIMNAALSGLTSAWIYRTGVKHFDRATGLLATALWLSIALSTRFREAILSAFLVTLLLFLLPESDREPIPLSRWLALGGLAGAAMLCNTTMAAIFVPSLGCLWLRERRAGRNASLQLAIALAACGLIVLPWTARNYQQFHRLIPIRDNLGLELWVGNHEGVTYICDYGYNFPADNAAEYNQLGEIRFFDDRGKVAGEFIRSHPRRFLRLSLQRVFYFWSAPAENIPAMMPLWASLSLLSAAGAVLAFWRRGLSALPHALILLLFPLVYYVTHPLAIYRHPIEPVILLTGSFGLVSALRCVVPVWSDRFEQSSTPAAHSTNR
ncbi:MAG TPA: glycosyltransferase family 39 protein [Terriglobales bacterium]|nr:glycosyltransferase family 39 protein [Terriglobales bacterium]